MKPNKNWVYIGLYVQLLKEELATVGPGKWLKTMKASLVN